MVRGIWRIVRSICESPLLGLTSVMQPYEPLCLDMQFRFLFALSVQLMFSRAQPELMLG